MDPVDRVLRRLRQASLRHVAGVVVARDGEVVVAHAPAGRPLDQPAEVFSVTKSVLATAVLSAVRDGRISLDASLGDLLGARVPEPRRAARVRHLLAMTGGAFCGGLEDIDRVMELPGGWVDALLSAGQRHRPGAIFCYDNGGAHLLAAALHAAVGDLAGYVAGEVFGPVGIAGWEWPRDPEGVPWGFAGLRLSALDLMRCGEAWRTDTLGLGPLLGQATAASSAGGPPENLPYGWSFWVDEVAGWPAFLAAGWAGQYVLVVPAAAVTVVVTGDPERLRRDSGSGLTIARELVAAVAEAHEQLQNGQSIARRLSGRG